LPISTGDYCILNHPNNKIWLSGLLLLSVQYFVTGCTVGPNYRPPIMEMPQQWPHSSADPFSTVPDANYAAWWKIFTDEDLDNLIRRAIENNRDIEAAFYRIEEARALRDSTAGQYYPNINATGSYNRSLYRGLTQVAASTKPLDIYTSGINFLWEADLFGKIRRSVESSQASYQASIEDYHDLMVTLLADVCSNYIDLRTTQERIKYAKKNVEIQRKTLELTQNLYQAEIVGELDVRQAEFNLANTESEIPPLLIVEEASLNRLAVLLGELPGSLRNEISPDKSITAVKENIDIILPANLLRQRPDIRKAERLLAAQTASIGIAEADLYPALQLSGFFETQSLKFAGLGNINNKTYSYGPGLTWNLFDGNILRNNVKIQKALAAELLVGWQSTVLAAVEDVQNAMYSYIQQAIRQKSLENSVTASLRSVDLVQNLYQSGLTDFQNVLNTQRTLFIQQDSLATSNGLLLQDIVLIYKAFGAGWYNLEMENPSAKSSH
jgi:multidrug efflux system outer membrane protein